MGLISGLLRRPLFLVAALLGVLSGYRFVVVRHLPTEPDLWDEPPNAKAAKEPEAPRAPHAPTDADRDLQNLRRPHKEEPARKGVVPNLPDKPRGVDDIHLVFSTDCSAYQDWQALLLVHSARASGQKGRITRIASGCSPADEARLRALHAKLPVDDDLHFTPDYTVHEANGEAYPFNNKPNGFVHFLEHMEPAVTATIVGILDPDMIVLRAITPYIDDKVEVFRPGHPNPKVRGPDVHWVTKGHPVAQSYGYGGNWATWPELKDFVPPESPVFGLSENDAYMYYAAGPPYLAHVDDWKRMSVGWAAYTPAIVKHHTGLLAEMQAWSLGAVDAKLPHTVMYSMMASDLESGPDEEWRIIDELPPEHTCMAPDDFRALHMTRGDDGEPRPVPSVLHFCQLYREGLYMFAKRHGDLHDIFRCGGPLLLEPPPHVTTMRVKVHPGPRIEELSEKNAKRQTVSLCLAIKAMNAALTDVRRRVCPHDEAPPPVLHLTDLQPGDLADKARWKAINAI